MKARDLLFEFYEPADDEQMKAELSDTRRPRLTLRHIQKLRKMRDVRAQDRKEYLQTVQDVYGAPPESSEDF